MMSVLNLAFFKSKGGLLRKIHAKLSDAEEELHPAI